MAPKVNRIERTVATAAPLAGSHESNPSKAAPVANQTAAYPWMADRMIRSMVLARHSELRTASVMRCEVDILVPSGLMPASSSLSILRRLLQCRTVWLKESCFGGRGQGVTF